GFLLASSSKTPRVQLIFFLATFVPRRFRSRLATTRKESYLSLALIGRLPLTASITPSTYGPVFDTESPRRCVSVQAAECRPGRQSCVRLSGCGHGRGR